MNKINYYESIFSQSRKDIDDQADNLDGTDALYKSLLYHQIKKNILSNEDIDNSIQQLSDDESIILYKEIKLINFFIELKEKYPKLMTTVKMRHAENRKKEIDTIMADDIFSKTIALGKELYQSDEHPFHACIILARLYDYVEMTDEAIDILRNLSAWYQNSEILSNHIQITILNIYLRNEKKTEFKFQLEKINSKKLARIYQMAYMILNHQYILMWIYVIIFVLLMYLLKMWILLLLPIYIIINIIMMINLSKEVNRTLLTACVQNIFIVIVSTAMSILYYLVIIHL